MYQLIGNLIKAIKENTSTADLFAKAHELLTHPLGTTTKKHSEEKQAEISGYIPAITDLLDSKILSRLPQEHLHTLSLIFASIPESTELLLRVMNHIKDWQFLDQAKITSLDIAVFYQQPENVQKLLEFFWNKEILSIDKTWPRTVKIVEVRHFLWLKYMNLIAKKTAAEETLSTDKLIFDLYLTRLDYPNIATQGRYDINDELCTTLCTSQNLLIPHLLNAFFSQRLLAQHPSAPICFIYLKRAIQKARVELSEQLFHLYSKLQPDIPETEQKNIWDQLIPVMHAHAYDNLASALENPPKKAHEKIFSFLALRWGTGTVETILTNRFLGQDQLRAYLCTLPFDRDSFFQLSQTLQSSDAGNKENLIPPLLTIICDYLFYLPPPSEAAFRTKSNPRKNVSTPAIPSRFLMVSHNGKPNTSSSTTTLPPSTAAPKPKLN